MATKSDQVEKFMRKLHHRVAAFNTANYHNGCTVHIFIDDASNSYPKLRIQLQKAREELLSLIDGSLDEQAFSTRMKNKHLCAFRNLVSNIRTGNVCNNQIAKDMDQLLKDHEQDMHSFFESFLTE